MVIYMQIGKKDYKKLLFWFEIEKQPLYYQFHLCSPYNFLRLLLILYLAINDTEKKRVTKYGVLIDRLTSEYPITSWMNKIFIYTPIFLMACLEQVQIEVCQRIKQARVSVFKLGKQYFLYSILTTFFIVSYSLVSQTSASARRLTLYEKSWVKMITWGLKLSSHRSFKQVFLLVSPANVF